MKKLTLILISALAITSLGLSFSSCKKEKKEDIIIIKGPEKPEEQKPQGPISRDSITENTTVKWGDTEYTVEVTRKPDKSLDMIKNEDTGEKYYDNTVILKVLRDDNSEAISKKFTKENFKEYIPKSLYPIYSLLNIRSEEENNPVGGKLNFTVAVGDPDDCSDDYITLQLLMSKTGDVSVRQLVIDEKTGEEAEMEP